MRRLREGEWLRVEIRGRGPSHEPMLFAAELEGGAPVESLGMRLRMHGHRALLSWRPGPGAAGHYTVLLRGTAPGRLVTRETLEIAVEPAKPRRR